VNQVPPCTRSVILHIIFCVHHTRERGYYKTRFFVSCFSTSLTSPSTLLTLLYQAPPTPPLRPPSLSYSRTISTFLRWRSSYILSWQPAQVVPHLTGVRRLSAYTSYPYSPTNSTANPCHDSPHTMSYVFPVKKWPSRRLNKYWCRRNIEWLLLRSTLWRRDVAYVYRVSSKEFFFVRTSTIPPVRPDQSRTV
jgi:hypothetical protein